MPVKSDTYVVAVSGGVDSVALLDALAADRLKELVPNNQQQITNYKLIIAHFDHGIRPDSAKDAQFVGEIAKKYGLKFITKRVELGSDTSEDEARRERYSFLRQCCKEENASLITAHHQDDLVETAIINIIRGTGWRGLASLQEFSISNFQFSNSNDTRLTINDRQNTKIWRPLINVGKADILNYAKKYNLQWREDSTNLDQAYLRNYIRQMLLPRMIEKDPEAKAKLIKLIQETGSLKKEIATELQKILSSQISNIKYQASGPYILPRYPLIMYPNQVSSEIIYTVLTNLDSDWHPTALQLARALHFIKVGLAHKELEVSKSLKLCLTAGSVQFKKI